MPFFRKSYSWLHCKSGSTCIIGRKKYCCRGSSLQRTFDDGVDTALAINSSSESTTVVSLTTPTKVSALTTVKWNSQNTCASRHQEIGKCYWAGTGPDCEASCRSGEFMAATSIEVQGQSHLAIETLTKPLTWQVILCRAKMRDGSQSSLLFSLSNNLDLEFCQYDCGAIRSHGNQRRGTNH